MADILSLLAFLCVSSMHYKNVPSAIAHHMPGPGCEVFRFEGQLFKVIETGEVLLTPEEVLYIAGVSN